MKRQIVLDTETTGISHKDGHRVIEIGCVEMINRRLTGERYHVYLQPDRAVDAGAMRVHGITNEFLKDKPRFEEIVAPLLDFLEGAELIIHNAPFDVGFLNAELARLEARIGDITDCCDILDTLTLARQKHPGQRNNLDALCKRYQINNEHRDYHGALLDAEILADVYLAMTGGQTALSLEQAQQSSSASIDTPKALPKTQVIMATVEELEAHADYMADLE